MLVQRRNVKLLQFALATLYANFNRCFKKDVLLFHNGDFSEEDEEDLRARHGPEIRLRLLRPGGKYWSYANDTDKYAGYKNMCRFHGVLVYDYLAKLGYEYYMRLDDDSRIRSCISYDPFEWMETSNKSYAYRTFAKDVPALLEGLPQLATEHAAKLHRSQAAGLLEHFSNRTWDNFIVFNNFMMARISFWTSPSVREWLEKVEASGIQFRYRVGDAPVQTITMQMFMPKSEVALLTDFEYSHKRGCLDKGELIMHCCTFPDEGLGRPCLGKYVWK